jgi:hypothetical protein
VPAVRGERSGGSGSNGAPPWPQLRRDEHARPVSDELDDARLGSTRAAAVPDTYTELDALDDPSGLAWDRRPPQASDRAPEPSRQQLEALAALYEQGAAHDASFRRPHRSPNEGWPASFDVLPTVITAIM